MNRTNKHEDVWAEQIQNNEWAERKYEWIE